MCITLSMIYKIPFRGCRICWSRTSSHDSIDTCQKMMILFCFCINRSSASFSHMFAKCVAIVLRNHFEDIFNLLHALMELWWTFYFQCLAPCFVCLDVFEITGNSLACRGKGLLLQRAMCCKQVWPSGGVRLFLHFERAEYCTLGETLSSE